MKDCFFLLHHAWLLPSFPPSLLSFLPFVSLLSSFPPFLLSFLPFVSFLPYLLPFYPPTFLNFFPYSPLFLCFLPSFLSSFRPSLVPSFLFFPSFLSYFPVVASFQSFPLCSISSDMSNTPEGTEAIFHVITGNLPDWLWGRLWKEGSRCSYTTLYI